MEEKKEETSYTLQIFKLDDETFCIGFIDDKQLTEVEYAFNVHHAVFYYYDETGAVILYRDNLQDWDLAYNINRSKVISTFFPSNYFENYYKTYLKDNIVNNVYEKLEEIKNNETDEFIYETETIQ